MSSFSSLNGPRFTVGSQLAAGITKAQILPYSLSLNGGLSILNGPVQMGVAPLAPVPLGTLHVGPVPPTSGPLSLASIHVVHPKIGMNVIAPVAANMYGILNTYGFQQAFGSDFSFGLKQTLGMFNKVGKGVETGGTTKAEPNIEEAAPNRNTSGSWTHAGGFNLTGVGDVASAINSKKAFDIPHPTKEGWRLSHICVEGPTADVYIKGKLENNNVIKLPDYWRKLVDIETITINLTPIGHYQELFVEKIQWGTDVIVKNNTAGSINCHYHIMAERIDTEKNIVEYQGTWEDYPGDNSTRSIVGKDYDRRN